MVVTRQRIKKRKRSRKKKANAPLPLAYMTDQVLLQFLNLDLSTLRNSGDGYRDADGRGVGWELYPLIHRDLSMPAPAFFTDSKGIQHKSYTLQHLQNELAEVLTPIATAKKLGKVRSTKLQQQLELIIARLNNLHFQTKFTLLPLTIGGRPNGNVRGMVARDKRYQGVFSLGSEWIVRTDFRAGDSYNPRADFYGMIAEYLINGELALLRRCPCCQTFFIAEDARQIYLPPHDAGYRDAIRDGDSKLRDGDSKVTRGSQRVKVWRAKQS